MIGEGGSEWSLVELYSDYSAVRSHNVIMGHQRESAQSSMQRVETLSHSVMTSKGLMIGRGPETSFTRPEHGTPEGAEYPGCTGEDRPWTERRSLRTNV